MTSREAFEKHMIMFTGRDMEYHQRNQTTGIKHALEAWQAAIEWSSKSPRNTVIDGATTKCSRSESNP